MDQVPETVELLGRAVGHFGTQQAVADFLGVHKGQMSKLMAGKRHLRAAQAARLAEAMGENWMKYVLPLLAEKAPTEADREYWLGKAKALMRAAGLLVGVGVGSLAPPGDTQAYDKASVLSPYYTMVLIIRYLKGVVRKRKALIVRALPAQA